MRELHYGLDAVCKPKTLIWGAIALIWLFGLSLPLAASTYPSISINELWPSTWWTWTSPSFEVTIKNRNEAIHVDVYFGLLLPDGTIYTANETTWTSAPAPWAPNVLLPNPLHMRHVFVQLPKIPGAVWPTDDRAECYLLAALTDPGTLDFRSDISIEAVTFLVEQPREQNIGSVAQQVLLMGIRAQRYYWTPCSEGGGGQSFTGIGMWEVGPAQNEDGDTFLIFSASCSSVGIMGTCSVAVADDGTPVTVVADVTAEEIRVSINE